MDGSDSHKSIYMALGFGAATFFIQMTSLSSVTRNGVLTSCSYMDFFALIAGVILFFYGMSRVFKSKGDMTAMLLSGAVVVFAVVHVARGLGLIMSPCG